ncbi:Ig domain-containing protein [Paenarthrobacter nitroguajacolicus]|uniref:Ig domain-containing protein n=1 Tax=Paenarthrobacter nitroguajacolicus TaxID=211146 RepID=UPI00286C345B|nr:Ig domain-containing protein [Paenarthrobacter nitroguajacolicus]
MLAGLIPAQAAPVTTQTHPSTIAATVVTQPADTVIQDTPQDFKPPVKSPFADIATSQQFYKEMAWLAAARVSTGWTEANGTKTYRALLPVNRDAMAAFMYRLSGSPGFVPPKVSPFADVSTSQQFYKEMAWLASTGISTGWTEANGTKTYRATQPVNRDAMAAFLYRLAGSPDYTAPATTPFADITKTQQFYKEMTWLSHWGISTGWTESNGTRTYRALQSVNRDAMAAFMYRFQQFKSPLTITNEQLMDGIAGVKYLDQLKGAGGFGELVWKAQGLPQGLTISPDGAITGLPTVTGPTPVTVTATDSSGMTVSRTLTLDVPQSAPQECVGKPCEVVVPKQDTIHVPGNNIVAITRDPATKKITSIELIDIVVAQGQVLTLAPWANVESGAVLIADDVSVTTAGTKLIKTSPGNLSSAYSEGTVHFTTTGASAQQAETPPVLATPQESLNAVKAKMECDRGATADLKGLSVTPDLEPSVYAEWGWFGLHLMQANIDGSITVNMGAAVSGEGKCTMTVPEVKVTVPSGAGAIVMAAQPSITFEVTGKLDISASVVLKCGTSYQWRDQQESRSASCSTEHEPLALSSDSGIDATLTGALDTRITWMDIVGITGKIEASLEAGFHPTEDPMAELKASAGVELGACAFCFWEDSPAKLTVYSGTIFEKTIATWSAKPQPPGAPEPEVAPKIEPLKILTTSLPGAVLGKQYKIGIGAIGGVAPYAWKISKGSLPAGLSLNAVTGVVSGTPSAAGTTPMTFSVTDSRGISAAAALSLVVNPKPVRGNKVLVYGSTDEGYGVANVAQTLRAAGADVVISKTLPAELGTYKSIWNPSYNGWTAAEEQQVAGYVIDGGAAYLTGERPCCEEVNDTVQRVLRQVLVDQDVVVGRQGDVDGPYTFNSAATNQISKAPNVLSAFEPLAPGAISGLGGVDARNVFARSDSTVVGGVWSEADMKSKRGRVVVLMDINYLEYDTRAPILQNVQNFLSKTP